MITKKSEAAITELLISYLDGSRPFGADDRLQCSYAKGCAFAQMVTPEDRETLAESEDESPEDLIDVVELMPHFSEVDGSLACLIQILHDACARIDYTFTSKEYRQDLIEKSFYTMKTQASQPFVELEKQLVLFINSHLK